MQFSFPPIFEKFLLLKNLVIKVKLLIIVKRKIKYVNYLRAFNQVKNNILHRIKSLKKLQICLFKNLKKFWRKVYGKLTINSIRQNNQKRRC